MNYSKERFSKTLWSAATLAVAFALASCVSAPTSERRVRSVIVDGLDVAEMSDVLRQGFVEIKDRALEDPAIDTVFFDALIGLQKIEPQLQFSKAADRVMVSYGETPLATVYPIPHNNIPGWSKAVVDVVLAARKMSAPMKAADAEEVYHAAFNGALHQIDPYSRYAGRQDAARNRLVRDGVIGLGVRVVSVAEGVLVQAIVKDGPAALAGVQINDVITHADGMMLASIPLDEARRYLDGASDTMIQLTLLRPEIKEPLILIARRDLIVPDTVTTELVDGVLQMKVRSFNQRTAVAVERAVNTARAANGGDLKGLVIDFRGDPGGLFDQAVDLADLFLDGGTIVALRGRHPGAQQFYAAHRGDILGGAPIIVLVDGRTASASEIVAAALQDNRRAVVVGTVSLGKGSVQTVVRLPNHGEIALTWSRSFTPRGAGLHGLGVLPDVCLSGEERSVDAVVSQIYAGMDVVRDVRRAWQSPPTDPTALEALRSACAPEPHVERTADLEFGRRLAADPILLAQALRNGTSQLAVKP